MSVPGALAAGSECLSDDEVAGLVAGELDRELERRLADHVDACDPCRRLVSALAQVERARAEPPAELGPGAQVGRFTLARLLGRGAMGQVWAARDPQLDREVALKLLHVSAASLETVASPRLRREAQAMARLDHPNVVAIHELGVDGGRVFCAMALVDGVTLRDWCATPRRWRDVLAVAIAAGRGLAAAHAAGLIHRDIKPENILIARDGRALVTDFGLAKLADAGAIADEPHTTDAEHDRALATAETVADRPQAAGHRPLPVDDGPTLTRTGALIGTPAYMPPEQLAGEPADDTGDQFSYCVTVYEALFGARPFGGPTIGELEAAIRRGPPRPTDARGVPGRVLRCLRRGLAVDKAARWTSLTALLDELDRARHRRRRGVQVAAAVAVAGAAAAAIVLGRSDPREAVRAATESRIAAAWNPVKRVQIDAGFRMVAGALADERIDRTIRAFDTYRAEWVRQRLDAWAATHVRGEQTVELLERRLACFDRLADTLGALSTLLTRATAAEVARAPQIAYQLEPVSTCAQLDRLLAAPAAPSSEAGKLAERGLRELEALQRAGRHAEALDRAQALVVQSQSLGDPAILARARYNLGFAQANAGKLDAAEATLRLAVQDAAVARDHYLVADAWLRLHSLIALELDRPAAAAEIEPAVAAAVAQAGNDPRQLADLATTRGIAATALGDFAAARERFVEARDRRVTALGPDHPAVGNAESNLGATLSRVGRLDEATRSLERAIAIIRRALGEHDPVIARAEANLSAIAAQRRDWAASEQHERAALAVAVVAQGPDHAETGRMRIYLARALREQHRLDEARRELDLARATLERALPATHAARIALVLEYALLAEAEGHWDEAERLARQTLATQRELKAPPIRLAYHLGRLAHIIAHRAPREALALYDEALTLDTARKERDDSDDVEWLDDVAHAALDAGQPERALTWFDQLPGAAAKLPALRGELERARHTSHAR